MSGQLTRRDALKTMGLAAGAIALNGLAGSSAMGAVAGGAGGSEMAEYTLPSLPYAYDALEPALGKETLTLHHDKHHAAYVKGLNTALDKLKAARAAGDTAAAAELAKAVAFHGSGHVLHSVYWTSMAPKGGGQPSGALADMLNRDFGSYAVFKAEFVAVTTTVSGSGWGVLAFEPVGRRLVILNVEKHENQAVAGSTPLLVCDVWEHAYYLNYQNQRGAYVGAFMDKLVDWTAAQKRLEATLGTG